MHPINPIFADYLKRRGRSWEVSIEIDGVKYGKDRLVEFSIENSLAPGSDFTIGAAIASSMTLKMRLLEDLPIGAKVVPYISANADDLTWDQASFAWDDANITWLGGGLEGMPLGEFYIDGRSKINDIYVYTCLDKLVLANSAYVSGLTYPTTMQAVWNEICADLELVSDSSVQINPAYTIQAGPAGFTMREVLSYIASANCASVYIGKDGFIKFRRFTAADNPVFDMDTPDYFRLKQTNPVRTFTKVEVTYDVEDKLSYSAGSGDENATIAIENPFVTQQIVNDMQATLDGFSFMPVEIDARGYPQIEVGDRITVAKQESNSWLETITPWDQTDLTWEGKTYHQTIITLLRYSFTGGLGMSCKSVSKSTQQSEFNNPKVLEQQVNRQTQNALRFDKPYYGVTHSRTQGMVIQREDGLSKLTLNSDVMDWQVNGMSSLYYDALANRIKFTGTLEGVDGTFSGTVSAAAIIGSTITGGTINGTTISGTNIYGSYIATGLGVYPFIEFSSTARMLAAYGTATRYIKMEANTANLGAPFLSFGFDGQETELAQLVGGFIINAKNGGRVEISGSRISLASPTHIQAASWAIGSLNRPDSIATDVDGLRSDFNALLLFLRSMRVLS